MIAPFFDLPCEIMQKVLAMPFLFFRKGDFMPHLQHLFYNFNQTLLRKGLDMLMFSVNQVRKENG